MSTVDPHEAERELRDEPKPTARVSTIVGDHQHDAETPPECTREIVRKARIEGATEGEHGE